MEKTTECCQKCFTGNIDRKKVPHCVCCVNYTPSSYLERTEGHTVPEDNILKVWKEELKKNIDLLEIDGNQFLKILAFIEPLIKKSHGKQL